MKVNPIKTEPRTQQHYEGEEHEEHGHHGHHDHGSIEEHDKREPYRFQMQAFAAGSFVSHSLPKPIFCPGFEAAALFGVRQGKKDFLLGPAFQWSKGLREDHGIESRVRNLFTGLLIQFGRSFGQRWTLSGGPAVGWRHLKASNLVLEQGIILSASKAQAFELQGHMRISVRATQGLEFFTGLRFGHAFYLVESDSLLLGGFNLAAILGISFGKLNNKD